MSYTTTVRVEVDCETGPNYAAIARVTLFPCPRGCVPDPPDVRWEKVILGCGTELAPEQFSQALEERDEWAIELATEEFADAGAD